MSREYLNTVDRIEPEVVPLDRDGALASIAISLKRIADSLEATRITEDEETVITLPQIMLRTSQALGCINEKLDHVVNYDTIPSSISTSDAIRR